MYIGMSLERYELFYTLSRPLALRLWQCGAPEEGVPTPRRGQLQLLPEAWPLAADVPRPQRLGTELESTVIGLRAPWPQKRAAFEFGNGKTTDGAL